MIVVVVAVVVVIAVVAVVAARRGICLQGNVSFMGDKGKITGTEVFAPSYMGEDLGLVQCAVVGRHFSLGGRVICLECGWMDEWMLDWIAVLVDLF